MNRSRSRSSLGALPLRAVLSPLPPLGEVSLDGWFLGLLFSVRACFQLCFEVKGQLKLLASYCEVQCKFSSSPVLLLDSVMEADG